MNNFASSSRDVHAIRSSRTNFAKSSRKLPYSNHSLIEQLRVCRGIPQSQLMSANLNMPITDKSFAPTASKMNTFNLRIPTTPQHMSPPVPTRENGISNSSPTCENANLHLRRSRTRSFRDKQRGMTRVELRRSRNHGDCYVLPTELGRCQHLYRSRTEPKTVGSKKTSSSSSYFPMQRRLLRKSLSRRSRRWSFIQLRNSRSATGSRKTFAYGERESFSGQQDAPRFEDSTYREPHMNDAGVVAEVYKTLTARKLPNPRRPDLITLRRASDPLLTSGSALAEVRYSKIDVLSTMHHQALSLDLRSDAYVVTRDDIDLITRLIQHKLGVSHAPLQHPKENTALDTERILDTRTPLITNHGLVVGTSAPSIIATTNTDVQPCLESWFAMANFYDHVSSSDDASPVVSRQKSLHEVIWEAGVSPECALVVSPDCRRGAFSAQSNMNVEEQSNGIPVTEGQDLNAAVSKSLSISTKDVTPTTMLPSNQCSTRCSSTTTELSRVVDSPANIVINDADSVLDTCRMIVEVLQTPTPELSSVMARNASVEDVLSFPPLPNRNSADWNVPLPPIETPNLSTSRSLHNFGVRQSTKHLHQVPSFLSTRTSWIRLAESSTPNGIVPRTPFDPAYKLDSPPSAECSCKTDRIEPCDDHETHQVSDATSPKLIQRVQTIDHAEKGQREGHWSPVRPPSVYPPSQSPLSSAPSSSPYQSNSSSMYNLPGIEETPPQISGYFRCRTPPSPRSPAVELTNATIVQSLDGKAQTGVPRLQLDTPPHICDDCFHAPHAAGADVSRRDASVNVIGDRRRN